jgi:hypothetical protein
MMLTVYYNNKLVPFVMKSLLNFNSVLLFSHVGKLHSLINAGIGQQCTIPCVYALVYMPLGIAHE